jgi:hypothetical protein
MVAIGAFAEPGVPKGPKQLQSVDADGDKMISLAEAQQAAPGLASRFNELDANKDGLLSIDEALAGQPMHDVVFTRNIDDDFVAADGNSDGKLSRAEANEAMPIVSDFFGEMDTDADGFVTRAEIHEHAMAHGGVRVFKQRGAVKTKE